MDPGEGGGVVVVDPGGTAFVGADTDAGRARGEGDSGAEMGMGSGTRRGGPWDPAGRMVGGAVIKAF